MFDTFVTLNGEFIVFYCIYISSYCICKSSNLIGINKMNTFYQRCCRNMQKYVACCTLGGFSLPPPSLDATLFIIYHYLIPFGLIFLLSHLSKKEHCTFLLLLTDYCARRKCKNSLPDSRRPHACDFNLDYYWTPMRWTRTSLVSLIMFPK